jgi:hypothetical protein
MNSTKTIELLRKRNVQLQEELDRLKELHLKQESNDPESKKVSELITDLENIRTEWMKILEELNQDREEYIALIDDLRTVRKAFKELMI